MNDIDVFIYWWECFGDYDLKVRKRKFVKVCYR